MSGGPDTGTGFGAKLSEDGIVETFDNDDDALDAVENGVVVCDYFISTFLILPIEFSGEDRIQFLHNQSTANFECLQEGQGCDTVFVTPTARTIDIGHAWIMVIFMPSFLYNRAFLSRQSSLISFLNKKFACTEECSYIGSLTDDQWKHNSNAEEVNRMPVTVAAGNIISEEGFSLLMSPAAAGTVWKTLLSQGAIPMGSKAWETFRVFQGGTTLTFAGRPAPGKELTDEYNVLEAGLWNSISMNKGCYKGQETISRLITYDGVKQRLWGIRLSSPVEPGTPIIVDAKKVGKLTSYAAGRNESEHFGLGYIKRKAASEGDTVNVGDNAVGTVVAVPFLARQCPPPSKSSNS
ncbi:hypothetical protein RHMOL_Rhmol11G0190900 [Rhododendron molle]|uniref:Uncharacterized protein n=1 Tax=Rhododendron molle TaxID=49168 RepID=A0ACC0LVG1_RHOML|nr:hypothetical protein RHMOL_Rhmol11G0190900 [Rhododendron molle]